MRHRDLLFSSIYITLFGFIGACLAQPAFPGGVLDDMEEPEPGYNGPRFKPSYDFPTSAPFEKHPWEAIDFKTQPQEYLEAVLRYVLEGQDKDRWDVSANKVRKWYHMPWMGPGAKGREYISGLTSERRSRPTELGPGQLKCRQNWAVGFYNPTGGLTLGRVWKPVRSSAAGFPDLSAVPFEQGTVVAKALYTQADASEVPLLVGAPTIQARIVVDDTPDDLTCPTDTVSGRPAPRGPATLRLLQLDVAIRDARSTETGWVFGTFIYDGRLSGSDPWAKVRPVGLMWGNDPDLTDALAASGTKPKESVVLSNFGLSRNFGRGGRMNGPVDNPDSSCLSCHSTAQAPSTTRTMAPSASVSWFLARCYFRNIPPTVPFGEEPTDTTCGKAAKGEKSMDYSLQLAVGVRNHALAKEPKVGQPAFFSRKALNDMPATVGGVTSYPISRDEDD